MQETRRGANADNDQMSLAFFQFYGIPFGVQATPYATTVSSSLAFRPSNRFDLEVQSYQREDQCLEILHKIVEHTQALRVLGFGNIDEGTNFSGLEEEIVII